MCGHRDVIVTVSHVGIEPDLITERTLTPKITRDAEELKLKFPGKKIIAGIDNTVWPTLYVCPCPLIHRKPVAGASQGHLVEVSCV